jgi:hypothetical protein
LKSNTRLFLEHPAPAVAHFHELSRNHVFQYQRILELKIEFAETPKTLAVSAGQPKADSQ